MNPGRLGLLLAFWTVLCTSAAAQLTKRITLGVGGATTNGHSYAPVVSDDHLYVVYESDASNLVPNDTNGARDIFLYDVVSMTTTRVSLGTGTTQGNSGSYSADISADNRYVAFSSLASNLTPGDNNGVADIFVRDLQLGTTQLASITQSGIRANNDCRYPSISATGQYVTFETAADTLVTPDSGGYTDIFWKDLTLGTLQKLSIDSAGNGGVGHSNDPAIDSTGFIVSFTTIAPLLPVDGNGSDDVYLFDISSFSNPTLMSALPNGTSGPSGSSGSDLSSNAARLVFDTQVNFVAPDTNGDHDVYRRDLGPTPSYMNVSVSSSGTLGNGPSRKPSISSEGQHVAYSTGATNLGQYSSAFSNVMMRDVSTSTTYVVSRALGGQVADGHSDSASVSTNGAIVAFRSDANNLDYQPPDSFSDIFISDPRMSSILLYCFGDGGGTPCPCGNTSPVGLRSGCLNSTAQGARLQLSGRASISSDTLTIASTNMTNGACLYYQGTAFQSGGLGSVFGDGLRCVGGTIVRLGIKNGVSGASQYPEAGDPSISIKGLCAVGQLRMYQAWYRDPISFCTPLTFNLSNGAAVTWEP